MSTSIRNILVPTDFSDFSETALAVAVSLANRLDSEVSLLHITPPPGGLAIAAPEPMYLPPQFLDGIRRRREEHVTELLDNVRNQYHSSASITTLSRSSNVVDGLVDHAREIRADLIVMGSQGRGATRFLVGSVAEKVTRRAQCPVLVTRAHSDEGCNADFEKIVVAVDYSPFSEPCARFAADLLVPGGTLEFIHAWDEPYLSAVDFPHTPDSEFYEVAEAQRAYQSQHLQGFVEALELEQQSNTYVAGGSPPKAILNHARSVGASLVVVGAHSSENLTQVLMGTVSDRVLRHAETPVLLIPSGALESEGAVFRPPVAEAQ